MAIVSTIRLIRRRASQRMVAGLPIDIEDRELDDPLELLVGRVREVLEKLQAPERGKSPAVRRARFGIPAAPMSSRLRSSAGFQTVHFAVNPTRERSAASFDRYSTQKEDPNGIATDELRPAAEFDGYALGHGAGDESAQSPSMVTTLDPDADVRRRQWDEIERHERGLRRNALPGPPRTNIRFERDPELLLEIAGRGDCPSGLRSVIMAERDRVARGEELPARLVQNGVPWISDDAPRAMNWLRTLPAWRHHEANGSPCAKLSPGRGVVTVLAGEVELPTCLDQQGRSAVMREFNNHVQGFVRKGTVDDAPIRSVIPFLAVEHQPGQLNDDRNAHLHFQIATRAVKIGPAGELIFDEHKVADLTAKGAIYRLRSAVAELINSELERLDAGYRLSPKSYAELGIEAAIQAKLSGERTVLERAGVPTSPGIKNAAEGWRREFATAQAAHTAELTLLDQRDGAVCERIRRMRDEEVREQRERERAAAYDDVARALALQLEIAEIGIHIAMARSRPDLTARYAQGYADKARRNGRDTWDSSIWRERGNAAEDYLARLDEALSLERQAVMEREAEAARLTVRANARYALIEQGPQPTASEAKPFALHPARAVTLIAERGLYLSRVDGQLGVRPEHDPEGLVRGVDLSGQGKRLEGVRASQERELAQLRARIRKRGPESLDDEALTDSTDWMRAAARRWRDTAIFRKMTLADRALARAYAHQIHDDIVWLPFDPIRGAPRTLADLTPEERANLPIELSPEVVAAALPAPDRALPSIAHSDAPTPLIFGQERRILRQRLADRERDRQRINVAINRAIEARCGDRQSLTPHAARLLGRLRDGFDPTRVNRRIGITGRTLDQRDADEIGLLMRHPLFAERVAGVRKRDAAILRLIEETLAEYRVIDKLGRVSVQNGKVVFDNPATVEGALHAPADLARQTLDRLGGQMPRLSRHKGLFGIYDRELLELSGNNYIGLLDPVIQHRVEAIWRVQREEERALLFRIRSGEIKAQPVIGSASNHDRSPVWIDIRGATNAERHVADRCSANPYWHVACRRASEASGTMPRQRHPDPVVRAALRAVDDRAPAAVVDQLVIRLRAIRPASVLDELEAADRTIVNELLSGRRRSPLTRTLGESERQFQERGCDISWSNV